MNALRYILKVDARGQILLLVLVVASVLLGLAPVHLARLVFDRVIPRHDTGALAAVAAALAAAVVAKTIVDYAQTIAGEKVRQAVIAKLRSDLFAHVLRVSPDFFTRTSVGQIVNQIQTEVGRFGMSVASIFVEPLVHSVTFVAYAAYLLSMNWKLALLAVTPLPIVAALVPPVDRRLTAASRQFGGIAGAYAAALQEALSAAFEVQVHGTFGYERERVGRTQDRVAAGWMRIVRYTAWLTLVSDLARGAGPVLVYTYGALLAIRGSLGVGEIVAFAAVLGGFYQSVDKIIKLRPMLETAGDRLRELSEYFDVPRIYHEIGTNLDRDAPAARVTLEGVAFRYDARSSALEGVDLDVLPGEHVAFVGRSGCGKSTTLGLVGGRLRAHEGAVRIDGAPVEGVSSAALAATVGLVGQSPLLFSTTIRDNLLYALFRLDGDASADPKAFLDDGPLGGSRLGDAALDALLVDACRDVGLGDDLFDLGLRARVNASRAARLIEARRAVAQRLGPADGVAPFDPSGYMASATVAENLLFAPLGETTPHDGALAAWVAAARRPEVGLVDLLARIGWDEVAHDLDYLLRVAAESPDLLAELGVTKHEVEERAALADRARGREISDAALGRATVAALARRGLLAHTSDPGARRRLVAARARFAHAVEAAGAREPYRADAWHPALTVRENLLFGHADGANVTQTKRLTDALREEIARLGMLDEVATWGLDFHVGERGSRLSGGQKQKISIARVLLKRPRLLLLDEATASLDQRSARAIYDLVAERYRDTTVVAVTHQLAWLDGFDRVVVFDRGRVVEQGSPAELIACGAAFRELYDAATVAVGAAR